MQVHSSKILKKTQLTPYAQALTLAVGEMVRSGTGEFVHIRCGDALLLRRPISVCTSQKGEGSDPDQLTIVFEPRGEGTTWLSQREVGDVLDVMGLLGNQYDTTARGRYLLVGGGIGIPPLLGVAQHIFQETGIKSTAILGFRSKDREMLLTEFGQVCSQVLTATDDGTAGYHGFVDAVLRQELEQDSGYVGVLACGPTPMLKNTVAVAKSFHLPSQVSMEERMGCGVGACLVCACDKKDGTRAHVCKDGPVFWGEEMDWHD